MNRATPPTAEKSSHGNQTHFLSQKKRHGAQHTDPPMGHYAIEHAVFFFEDRPMGDEHPVALSLKTGGFSAQEYLSVHEARTLAQALNMAADHASGEYFGTETAALQARAQAGLLAAALDGNPARFAFFSGQLSFARNLGNGTGERLAAKDAALAASGDHAQTSLERAWAALPVGAEKLTMAQVQQLLTAQGIKVAFDGVAGVDIDPVEQFEHGKATAKLNDEHAAPAVDGVNGTLHVPLPLEVTTVAQEGGAL